MRAVPSQGADGDLPVWRAANNRFPRRSRRAGRMPQKGAITGAAKPRLGDGGHDGPSNRHIVVLFFVNRALPKEARILYSLLLRITYGRNIKDSGTCRRAFSVDFLFFTGTGPACRAAQEPPVRVVVERVALPPIAVAAAPA